MNTRFDQIIGVGGIGSGILFETDNDRTLDRNESRLANLSDARDYCKQHIILHYVATVLADQIVVHAIGSVGKDSVGERLLCEMKQAGIRTDMVSQSIDHPTMYSVCFQYPDKCVCNITTSNSAGEDVTVESIMEKIHSHGIEFNSRTLVLAVPEVPVASRLSLLRAGKSGQATCVASVLCDEVEEFRTGGGFGYCDVLSVNEAEAKAITGTKSNDIITIVEECSNYLRTINSKLKLIVTCGKLGSYSSYQGVIEYIPAGPAVPVSTAGAGDAYLAGIICGLSMGFPFQHSNETQNRIRSTDLGFFLAEESVKSKHTISEDVTREMVMKYIGTFVEDRGNVL